MTYSTGFIPIGGKFTLETAMDVKSSKTAKLSVTGKDADVTSYTWESSNPKIASVVPDVAPATAVVTGGSVGKATITAKARLLGVKPTLFISQSTGREDFGLPAPTLIGTWEIRVTPEVVVVVPKAPESLKIHAR